MTNPRADRVKRVARLAGRSARLREGLFLAEGPQSCREALRLHLGQLPDGSWQHGSVVESVYVSESWDGHDDGLSTLVDRAASQRVPVRTATAEVLAAMSDAVTPQGIVAVCRVPESLRPTERVASSDQGTARVVAGVPEDARLVAVLCRVQDPGNAGTIIRAADAAGADAVLLTGGSVDVLNPKTVRSTAGSLFHLPVVSGVDLACAAQVLEARGVQLLAADGYGDIRLDRAPEGLLEAPSAWLFGNEAQGLDEAERALAAHRVAVPLYGAAESLNVGTAATVCLYGSAMAQHQSA